ncbi:hypothetical protein EF914_12105 [Streptomyces sp. WAC05458]|uniref:DUF8175 domain-containing protein n=2 Tax=Streptomyces rochei TaxID=1928 RepID=A0AAX3ZKI9_STRRO|nr:MULTISPECIES: hypothetical protein [Streptomyces]QCR48258.1 hypothetical protein C1N79_17295 [Streptomyces sp. SGAir0924]RSS23466.1 hypothetical protein EF914_12105 [Streptomyces sp. WAC05458]WMC87148.1 hypothetical protein P7W03_16920 [Streptomyces rochei]
MSLGDDHQSSGGHGGMSGTRVRLPEEEGGHRRGGRSSSRSLVTVVGVVVLLIAAIAFANRGGDESGSSDAAADKPKTSSTAPSGTAPVQSGFAHDEQGAQSAAANYAVTLGSTGMFNVDSRHSIVDAIYTPTAAAKLQGAMDSAYSADFLSKLGLDANGNPPKGSSFVSRTIPVGTKVEQYSDASAKVSVWYMGLIGMSGKSSTDPVTTTWKTWTFDLEWVNDDWKIVADTQKEGPAPLPGDDRASRFDEISKAVEEYGGFTYAR